MKTICVIILSSALLVGCAHWKVDPKVSVTTYSKGSVLIRGTYFCDLDLGRESSVRADDDFLWEHTSSTERYITPRNGAKYSLMATTSLADISYSDLTSLTYSTDKINASPSRNQIPTGRIVAYITNSGRYGAFRVVTYDYNLTLSWITYDVPK